MTPITVSATGTGTLSYQWYRNRTNSNTGGKFIPGATSATYTPPILTGTEYYYVVVSNSGCPWSITSSAVSVTAHSAIWCDSIAEIPPNGTITVNGIEVTSASSGSVSILSNIETEICTGTGFIIPDGALWVGSGTVEPTPASAWSVTLTFDQPVNDFIILIAGSGYSGAGEYENFIFNSNGGAVSISSDFDCGGGVTIIGNELRLGGDPIFFNSDAGGIFRISSPSDFTTLTINGAGGYAGSAIAICDASIVLACDAPTINSITPATQSVCIDDAAPLTVSATGTGTLSYQWYSNATNSNAGGTAIVGATSATYNPSTSAAGTTYYYAVVSDSDCPGKSATSSAVSVTVNECDSDGDGVPDHIDLDDDNDGILDIDECGTIVYDNFDFILPAPFVQWDETMCSTMPETSLWYENNPTYYIGPPRTCVELPGYPVTDHTTGSTNSGSVIFIQAGPGNDWLTALDMNYTVAPNSTYDFSLAHVVWHGSIRIVIDGVAQPDIIYTGFDFGEWTVSTYPITTGPGTNLNIKIEIKRGVDSGGHDYMLDDISLKSTDPNVSCDTDGDGIPNRLDLDSDNDGCLDAIEGDENVQLT